LNSTAASLFQLTFGKLASVSLSHPDHVTNTQIDCAYSTYIILDTNRRTWYVPSTNGHRLPGNSNEGGRYEKEPSVPSILLANLRYLHLDVVRRPISYQHDRDVCAYDLGSPNQPSTASYDRSSRETKVRWHDYSSRDC